MTQNVCQIFRKFRHWEVRPSFFQAPRFLYCTQGRYGNDVLLVYTQDKSMKIGYFAIKLVRLGYSLVVARNK